ncbi:MAG TPA: DinB family protein [Stellaceae bacterium]|nr:DinB family protein [Stellaceae bacterium]
MKTHFEQCAAYNRWANARLYEAALALSDADYRRDVGAFFKSMHGTLNHLLLTDRLWLKRLTGEGDHPNRLDAILYEDRRALTLARADEDDRIVRYVTALDDLAVDGLHKYATTSGKPFEQRRRDILAHLFNHQTHHRGQAHAILSICTGREPPSLDLLLLQRGGAAPDLRTLVSKSAG